jgi:hypothetical protein
MRVCIVLTITLFLVGINCQLPVPCGNSTCPSGQGTCITSNTISECVCNIAYTTYPEDSEVSCNYARKSRLTAFLLEGFLTYGIGHFYAGNYHYAIPKFFFFCFSYCLFVFLRMVVRNNEYNNNTSRPVVVSAYVFLILMIIWYISDIVLYALGIYKDGHGVDLIPW